MKFVIDNKILFIKGALEPFGEVLYLPGAEISPADVKDADAMIVRTRTKCNSELLSNSTVKFLATATIGFDHIDAQFCETRNISWQSAPGCNSYSVQQYIASALLGIAEDEDFQLKDKTLGIVGVGNVGSKVAKFAENLGMRVLLNDPPRAEAAGTKSAKFAEKFVSIDEIKKKADIITFHVPLNRGGRYSTHHIVNTGFIDEISNSGRKVWIMNSSRGEVVDNNDLKHGLERGKLAGAVLDVWEHEPEIDTQLLKLAKFATPHIAGYSADGKANGTTMSVQGVSRFFNLGIDNWQPENIPEPENCELRINCNGKSLQDVIKKAIDATYRISEDDSRLRNSTETFEKQRGDYPLRREPLVYRINLIDDSANYAEKLAELRFNLTN